MKLNRRIFIQKCNNEIQVTLFAFRIDTYQKISLSKGCVLKNKTLNTVSFNLKLWGQLPKGNNNPWRKNNLTSHLNQTSIRYKFNNVGYN